MLHNLICQQNQPALPTWTGHLT